MQTKKLTLLFFLLCYFTLFFACKKETSSSKSSVNSFNEQKIALGREIYRKNCMVCHKELGKGIKNWKQPFSDGSYPPPPLNGTAHTWHHPYQVLFNQIKWGSISRGGKMPAFHNTLTDEEIKNVITYVQSLWPKETYVRWEKEVNQKR